MTKTMEIQFGMKQIEKKKIILIVYHFPELLIVKQPQWLQHVFGES